MWPFKSRWRRAAANRPMSDEQALNAAVIQGSTAVAIIATGIDGVISLFNSGAEAMLGYQAREVVGIKTLQQFHEREEVCEHGRLLACEFGHEISGFDVFVCMARQQGHETRAWTYIRKDGSRLRVNVTVTTLRTHDGEISGYMGIANDISAYSALEEALNISQLSFLNAFATAAHGMAIVEPSGQLRDVNISLCEMLGYSHTELLALSFQAITYADDLENDLAQVHRCLAGEISSYQLEKRYVHRDGHTVYGLLSVSLVRDSEQEPLYFISHVQDLTARQEAKQVLRESEQHMRTIVDAVVDAIITIDANGCIERFNYAAEVLFGYAERDVQGQSVSILLPDELGAQHHALFLTAMHEHRPANEITEVEAIRADGSRFWMELQVAPLQHQKEPKQVAVVRDITERRRVERMKEEFISTVSHELRTPLTAIAGSLDLLVSGMMGPLSTDQEQLLSIAQRNSLRLSYLINDLLDMDRLVSGSIELTIAAHELAPIIAESISLNASYAAQYQVKYRLQSDCQGEVMVDAARLQQVLANFLSNAAKFSPEGSIVDLCVEDRGGYWRISVMDTGAGIPESQRSKLFAKFSQLDSSDTRQRSGTGLGLAITKALAECMHAHVGYAPREPHGSVFFIDLVKQTKVLQPLTGSIQGLPNYALSPPKQNLH